MFRAHVEATFESAHKNGPPGHKCAGTLEGVPQDVIQVIKNFFGRNGEGPQKTYDLLELLKDKFDYHGHSWFCEIEWDYTEDQLDEVKWGPDFGKVKDIIRSLDHHNLNLMFDTPSAEMIAKSIYHDFEIIFGFFPDFVRLHEGRGNTMTYSEPENN